LPRDVKQGFERLMREETDGTAKTILDTMVENIAVAERTRNLLCQDTGIPIYNVTIGRHVDFDTRDETVEMVQFHPTGLLAGEGTRMTGTVLEEGLRGSGGWLTDSEHKRFMFDYDSAANARRVTSPACGVAATAAARTSARTSRRSRSSRRRPIPRCGLTAARRRSRPARSPSPACGRARACSIRRRTSRRADFQRYCRIDHAHAAATSTGSGRFHNLFLNWRRRFL
jgi:hypothetical protein